MTIEDPSGTVVQPTDDQFGGAEIALDVDQPVDNRKAEDEESNEKGVKKQEDAE